jgi:uncharacterized membrane protein YfcA
VIAIDICLVVLAGFAAGMINTAVGSGSLITYPILVLVGVPPVVANITNTVGLAPGAIFGAWTYRAQLSTYRRELVRLVPVAVVGAILGASLLLLLPSTVFQFVVPVLIVISVALVAFQPAIARRMGITRVRTPWIPFQLSILAASIYGGYFSAAQGVILLGILGLFLADGLQAQNALKNLLQAVVNVVAALFFVSTSKVDWLYVLCIAVGAIIGAPVGARLSRRLPAAVFRTVIVVFGVIVAIVMVARLVF